MAKEPAGDLQHTEMLFDEINKLVKTQGLKKAIIHLQSVNNNPTNFSDISAYEFIIKSVLEVFQMTENQLYKDNDRVIITSNGKIIITDARRTTYYLLNKYLKIHHKSIAIQFDKKRNTVTGVITELGEMMLNRKFYKDYLDKHDEAERKVIQYMETANKKKNGSKKKN